MWLGLTVIFTVDVYSRCLQYVVRAYSGIYSGCLQQVFTVCVQGLQWYLQWMSTVGVYSMCLGRTVIFRVDVYSRCLQYVFRAYSDIYSGCLQQVFTACVQGLSTFQNFHCRTSSNPFPDLPCPTKYSSHQHLITGIASCRISWQRSLLVTCRYHAGETTEPKFHFP